MKLLAVSPNGDYVETPKGSTFIRKIGSGPPLVVVHGGPGLEHTYLVEWLLPLSQYRTLLFYDQCGCGRDRTPLSEVSASGTVDQLHALIEALDIKSGVGVFCHSWGSHVFLSLLQRKLSIGIEEAIISNPFALNLQRLARAGQRLRDRLPSTVRALVQEMGKNPRDETGGQMIQALLPYYVAVPEHAQRLKIPSFSLAVNAKVSHSIGNFNLREVSSSLPDRTLIIYGEKDFLRQTESHELLTESVTTITIPETGHFPFAENPQAFLTAVLSFIKRTPSAARAYL